MAEREQILILEPVFVTLCFPKHRQRCFGSVLRTKPCLGAATTRTRFITTSLAVVIVAVVEGTGSVTSTTGIVRGQRQLCCRSISFW